MSAHPAPRATRAIRAETAGSSALALGPNQRGKAGGEVEASIPVMAIAHDRTRGTVRRRLRTKRQTLMLRLHSGTFAYPAVLSHDPTMAGIEPPFSLSFPSRPTRRPHR